MTKVLYVAERDDPRDLNAGSGSDYQNYQALLNIGMNVELVGPFELKFSRWEQLLRRFLNLFIKKRLSKYSKSYLKKASAQVEKAIEEINPDVIFTFYSAPLSYCEISKPLVYTLDTTLIGHQRQWPVFSKLAFRKMLAWESRVIHSSSQVLTYSKWSADILQNDYQVSPERITYFAIPASIPEEVIPKNLSLDKKNLDPVHLLLVGRTYHRKGIDIVLQVVEELNQRGCPAELRIVGLSGEDTKYARYMGVYNKTVPEELERYVSNYQWAHFLIHPARFEAAGIVPGEAAAFGVPTITNDVGGLATTVKDGVSGVVLPKDSPANVYVKTIMQYVEDREIYQQLCISTKHRYEEELNWQYGEKMLFQAIGRALDGSKKLIS